MVNTIKPRSLGYVASIARRRRDFVQADPFHRTRR